MLTQDRQCRLNAPHQCPHRGRTTTGSALDCRARAAAARASRARVALLALLNADAGLAAGCVPKSGVRCIQNSESSISTISCAFSRFLALSCRYGVSLWMFSNNTKPRVKPAWSWLPWPCAALALPTLHLEPSSLLRHSGIPPWSTG